MGDDLQSKTDEELMRAFVDGDHASFRILFDRYAPMLLRMARRRIPSDDAAHEIVQQTFFRLHTARNDWRQDAKLRPWVVTIAMNLIREHYRRRGRRKEAPIEAAIHTVGVTDGSPLETQQRIDRVRKAIDQLPASQREVVELHWLQEMPFVEVAQIVGAKEGAVRVRAHRAYAKLREILAGELPGK